MLITTVNKHIQAQYTQHIITWQWL